MLIGGIQKTTLVDFPGHIASILFIFGCNFRCGFCHNPELVLNKSEHSISQDEIITFLKKRKHLVEAVVITGGEPLIYPEIYDFIKRIRKEEFKIKIDTNGSNPKMLQKLIDEKLVDFIAMDIKGPLSKYQEITSSKINLDIIKESIQIIKNSNLDYEFRTTIIPTLTKEDFEEINVMLTGAKKYALQQFSPDIVLDSKYHKLEPLKESQIKELAKSLTNIDIEYRI